MSDQAPFAAELRGDLTGLRIAWCPDLGGLPIEPDVLQVLDGARALLDALGCDVHDVGVNLSAADEAFETLHQQALRAAMATIAPELAADWPTYGDLACTLAGVAARRDNVSEVWAWLGGYEIARGYAASLFGDAQVAAVPTLLEHTADELNARLGTMAFWAGLSPRQRDALAAENQAFHQRLGRPIRSSTIACLVVARRQPRI